uniref:Alginate export domain-containing protein n=1 Tax=Candidatus Kentrum sp. MB TaxID=2138164 RepID=A0A450XS31_9GAMM|nr:MAG: hypothetical protein BECKMB1821G_GA0114241_102842 [Candidatus Kentron sp. MB]VFK32094.1 MAG: hypothetical protein BECKMB1821I_GA0114274_102941 [Candidatus Kentron sp. MB]VFK75644.1 MAG: hypothetical protein BECKMB1821H_GA0114242_10287 [Candidatus Kentron sp. MB]
MRRLFCACFAGILVLLSLIESGVAQTESSMEGYIRVRPGYRVVRNDTPNNPDSLVLTTPEELTRTFGLLQFDLSRNDLKSHFQIRPYYEFGSEETQDKIHIDEAYLDKAFSPSLFAFGGRRNIVNGIAHVSNPSDFLGGEKEIDTSLDETERRELRNGVYLTGLEYFFDEGSISALVAPRMGDLQQEDTQLQLKLALLYPELDTDIELLGLLIADRPGVGVNLSHTFNNSTVLYTESALRRGRDRSVVAGDRIQEDNRNNYRFNGVAGGQYTFDNGVNLIMEYLYDENGYSSGEWRAVQGFFQSNTADLSTPGAPQAMANLGLGNQEIIDKALLKQQYLFSRLNHPQWWGDADSSLILLKNLDDGSYLLRGRMEKDIADHVRIGIMAEYLAGDSWDEFGLRSWKQAVIFDLKYFF